MRPKELMKLLLRNGWKVVRIEGSHHIYQHPTLPGSISLPLHNKELATGTLNAILKAARITKVKNT